MTAPDDLSDEAISALWDEAIQKVNAESALAGRCLEYVGLDLPLNITLEELEMRLWPLVTQAARYREREIAVKKVATAKRLLRELRRARKEGLSNADADVDLNRLSESLKQLAGEMTEFQHVRRRPEMWRAGERPALRKPNWHRFIARDIGEAYAMAFDRSPGRSQTKGSDNIVHDGGPFVRFAYFIISKAPRVEGDDKGLTESTIARYVSDERGTIDRIWARHENW